MKKYLLISIISSFYTCGFAQFADFNSALPIANEGEYTISTLFDAGKNPGEVPTCTCLKDINFEKHSAWIKCKVKSAGTIEFDIVPMNLDDDLDFIVFQLPNGSFDKKKELRCMAAGESLGDKTGSMPCKGITGLSNFSRDYWENQGCSGQKDNFLAHLDAEIGDEFAISVNNFSSTEGFTLRFKGTAQLEEREDPSITISETMPNPAAQTTKLLVLLTKDKDIQFVVSNNAGQFMYKMDKKLTKGLHDVSFPLENLAAGKYQISIKSADFFETRNLIKL